VNNNNLTVFYGGIVIQPTAELLWSVNGY